MLSAVITALLLVVMMAIVVSFVVSGWREFKRQKQRVSWQTARIALPQVSGKSIYIPQATLSSTWYSRRRTLVSLGFFIMILLTFFVQSGLNEGALGALTSDISTPILKVSQSVALQIMGHSASTSASSSKSASNIPYDPNIQYNASMQVVRLDSASRAQYRNDYQWEVWSYSSCSGMAMTMVMNAYGKHLIAGDVLQEEANLGVWDVNLGLLSEQGITQTAAYFGFNSDESHTRTLQDIVTLANKGKPVIVGVRDGYYFPGGHIMVIRGGDGQFVYLADSSTANFQRMPYSTFLNMWQGFSAVLTPRS